MNEQLEEGKSSQAGHPVHGQDDGSSSGELWNQYNSRRTRHSVVTKVGTGLLWLIALAVVAIGLWIVAFR
ncbi:MAG: hypothetical protein RLZZ488_117 [Pseudomonadota bacterium]|jgi:hypothetical protein